MGAPDNLSPGPQRIYVASSWRNLMQEAVVATLRAAKFDVYDFKNPPEATGFAWSQVSPGYVHGSESMLPAEYVAALAHPRSVEGFESDFRAMNAADTFVLVLPCGRSAHLELGWAAGAGKRTVILLEGADKPMVPELMYLMVDHISPSVFELLGWLGVED